MTSTAPIRFDAFRSRKRKLELWQSLIFAGSLLFIALIATSYFVLNSHSILNTNRYVRDEEILGFGEMFGLILSSYSLLHFMTIRNKNRIKEFERFLTDNSWAMTKKIGFDDIASVLVNAGNSYDTSYAFTGRYGNEKFSCLIFQYLESVKDHSKTKRYLCLHFKLLKSYPMIVMTNLHSTNHKRSTPIHFKREVLMDLEGDFSKNYQIKTTKGNEQETLEVLTPDLMSSLADLTKLRVNIEVNDKDLYLYYEDKFYSEQNISSLFNVANILVGKLSKLSKTWMTSSKFEESELSKGALSVRYNQLSEAQFLIYVITMIVIFIIVLYIIFTNNQPAPAPGSYY